MVMSAPRPIRRSPEPPASWPRSLTPAVHEVGMQVDRDTVLKVRSVLLGEADRLLDAVPSAPEGRVRVGRCGGDPVSAEAAVAFEARIRLVVDLCQRHALELREAAHSLERIARNYGYTEAEIAASFPAAAQRVSR